MTQRVSIVPAVDKQVVQPLKVAKRVQIKPASEKSTPRGNEKSG